MRFVLIFCALMLPVVVLAQRDSSYVAKKNPLTIQLQVQNGGILPQKDLKNITYEDAYYEGLDLKIGWKQYKSKDPYFQLYNNPTYGVGIYSSTFHNNIIGNPFAVYGFVQTPISPRPRSRWSFDYTIGLGLSGNFKPFDEETNPLNLAIGSHNNVFINFALQSQYRFHPKWAAGVGLAFLHFSNGALALPNKGVNLVPLTFSVTYQPKKIDPEPISFQPEPLPKKWLLHVNFGAGLKQLRQDLDQRFLKSTLSAYASRHVSHKWRMGGGVDLFYSSSGNDNEIAGDQSGKLGSKLSGGPSFYLVHVLHHRLVLNGNIGYYIHNQAFNGEVRRFFLRAGTRYYVYKNLNAGVSIKAHLGKADFIEWTMGYTFNR